MPTNQIVKPPKCLLFDIECSGLQGDFATILTIGSKGLGEPKKKHNSQEHYPLPQLEERPVERFPVGEVVLSPAWLPGCVDHLFGQAQSSGRL